MTGMMCQKNRNMHKCISSITLYSVTIFSLLCNLSVNWITSSKSLCVFAHRWQFIICCEQFPYYYSLEPQFKGQYLSLPHTHTCLCTHALWPIHTNENENWNGGKVHWVEPACEEREMLIWRRYKILCAALFPLEMSFQPIVIQYLFNYGSL